MAEMTVEQALAVVDAFRCGGRQQVCCGYPQGGGMDENGNGEPPQCCGRPFDNDDLHHALATLRAELDGLRRDAERYRWLRDEARTVMFEAPLVFMADDFGKAGRFLDDADLDSAIDAARQQESSHEP